MRVEPKREVGLETLPDPFLPFDGEVGALGGPGTFDLDLLGREHTAERIGVEANAARVESPPALVYRLVPVSGRREFARVYPGPQLRPQALGLGSGGRRGLRAEMRSRGKGW